VHRHEAERLALGYGHLDLLCRCSAAVFSGNVSSDPGRAGAARSRPAPRAALFDDVVFMDHDVTMSTDPLADRYGRPARGTGPSGRPRLSVGARIAVAAALSVGVAGAAWFAWSDAQRNPVSFREIGFSVKGPEQVSVTFDVLMPPGTTAVCTVTALSPNYAEVGSLDVEVGPGARDTIRVTADVRTTQEATTGVVDRCSVTS
jgi:hypothetical protein